MISFKLESTTKTFCSKSLNIQNDWGEGEKCLTLPTSNKAIHIIQQYLVTLTFRLLFKSVLATEVSITLGPTQYIRRKKENNIEVYIQEMMEI